MAWSTIRKATDEEYRRLEAAAARFGTRHPSSIYCSDGLAPSITVAGIECWLERLADSPDRDNGLYLRRLWRKAVRRALRHPATDGIDYGYVGYSVP